MLSSNIPQHCPVKKKRVGKACDSCRIKKTKCDGKKPCNRCLLDNKICVFSEKRRVKEKIHPPGYIELLETRLDILSKSFETLIEFSRPHLSFIDEIVKEEEEKLHIKTEAPDDDASSPESNEESGIAGTIPINKVVSYLIDQRGMLKNVPIEWEEGAFIAANYNGDNLQSASKSFAEHKSEKLAMNEANSLERHSSPAMKSINRSNSASSAKSLVTKKIKEEPVSPASVRSFSSNFNFNNDERWMSNDPLLSEVESDSPQSIHETQEQKRQRSVEYDGHSHIPLTASLFSNTNYRNQSISKNSSVTSLNNKYEAHTLSSAPNSLSSSTPPSSIFTPNSATAKSALRRSSSTLSQTQHNKLKGCIFSHHHNHKSSHHTRQTSLELNKRSSSSEASPTGTVNHMPPGSQSLSAITPLANGPTELDKYYDAIGEGVPSQPSFDLSPTTNDQSDTAIDEGFYSEICRGPLSMHGPGAFEVLIGAYEDSFMNNKPFFGER
ncbi:FCR1 [Candida theae]|uniref:FCR1 n=1 Tax=Candida theae TaxID=1198502 RepID=A0AAD5FZG2_9ASCO|nr:FCR1 [Candida theae]KAI5961501.1 FCR1 [Candida theae]